MMNVDTAPISCCQYQIVRVTHKEGVQVISGVGQHDTADIFASSNNAWCGLITRVNIHHSLVKMTPGVVIAISRLDA